MEPSFHISFMRDNLVWFKSNKINRYIDYWRTNESNIKQFSKAEFKKFLDKLKEEEIINVDNSKELEIEKKLWSTNMTTVNVCPGFSLKLEVSSDNAISLDKKNEFEIYLKNKIKEGLQIINEQPKFLKN